MTRSPAPDIILDGLAFPEGPRWHEGRLWFSDQHDKRVLAMDTDGKHETIVEVPNQPSGLGWLPDGRMLVVSMNDRSVYRFDGGALTLHADLSALAPGQCNDMIVDATGRAYVGNFGFDMYGGDKPRDTCLIAVEPDGSARIAAEGLSFPNGTVITPDGKTMIVGESMGARLTAFDIDADGNLSNHREWAKIIGATPDGICLDAEGAVWIASPFTGDVLRIAEGGKVLETITTSHPGTFACMLGGPDRKTLYICTAPSHIPEECIAAHQGRIEAVAVDVPGAGLP